MFKDKYFLIFVKNIWSEIISLLQALRGKVSNIIDKIAFVFAIFESKQKQGGFHFST